MIAEDHAHLERLVSHKNTNFLVTFNQLYSPEINREENSYSKVVAVRPSTSKKYFI